MKFYKTIAVIVAMVLLLGVVRGGRANNLRISSPPLVSPEFSGDSSEGRYEAMYFGFENIDGYGFQGVWRRAYADNFALTPHAGLFYMSGDQKYELAGSTAEHELDYYSFASVGLTGEFQYRLTSAVNLILFAGPRGHYGRSEDKLTHQGTVSEQTNTDVGYGGEIGLQCGISLPGFYLTPFISYDRLDVDSSSTAEDVVDESLTFENQIIGIDVLHRETGWTLSGLVGKRDVEDAEDLDDLIIFKIGRSF